MDQIYATFFFNVVANEVKLLVMVTFTTTKKVARPFVAQFEISKNYVNVSEKLAN